MNKKINTLLFLLVGTFVNIIIMLIMLIGLLYLSNNFILSPESADSFRMSIMMVVVLISIVGSYFIYSRIIRAIDNKFNLERWIEPLFRRKKR